MFKEVIYWEMLPFGFRFDPFQKILLDLQCFQCNGNPAYNIISTEMSPEHSAGGWEEISHVPKNLESKETSRSKSGKRWQRPTANPGLPKPTLVSLLLNPTFWWYFHAFISEGLWAGWAALPCTARLAGRALIPDVSLFFYDYNWLRLRIKINEQMICT